MTLAAIAPGRLPGQLAGPGVCIRTGPFVSRIQSRLPAVAAGLALLYPDYPLADPEGFTDFRVRLYLPNALRRWWRPQVQFAMDGRVPFTPLPLSQAYPLLEWGLNWCITSHMHHYLLIHSAVVERNGLGVILPGEPGAGKSTLCAALMLRGWRLLSDEMAVIDLDSLELIPVVRPVSLKNTSIEVIRRFAPEAVISPPALDTLKGTVAHLRVPRASIERMDEPVRAGAIVFPRYRPDAVPAQAAPETPGRTLLRIAQNTFNYSLLGERAFHALTAVVQGSRCHDLAYAELEEAIAWFDRLSGQADG